MNDFKIHIKDQIDTRLSKGNMNGILLRDCKWSVKTAGPSPDNNQRTELFFLGCNKAMSGNPCKGCFNKTTWDNSKAEFSHDPVLMAKHIAENAPNKYVTIGGGEPTDQLDNLLILCEELKKHGFHIMMYTWKNLKNLITMPQSIFGDPTEVAMNVIKYQKLLKYVDIIVDGEYKQEERLWDGSKEDGLLSSIGSGNQTVWNIKKRIGYRMRDLKALSLTANNELIYTLKDNNCKYRELIK